MNNLDNVLDICSEIRDEFMSKMDGMHWHKKGIFFTEALAFIAMCKAHGVNTIIESGVRNGDSTEMWLKFFGEDIRVISVDLMQHKDDVDAAINRLSHYENLEFKAGDGEIVVPEIVRTLPEDAVVGMLLDGPKEFGAMRIAERCFRISDKVKFISIHDMGNGALAVSTKPTTKASIDLLRKWDNLLFDTDNEVFREKFASVDAELGGDLNPEWAEYKAKYPTGCGLAFLESKTNEQLEPA
jgi:hypothetical protein